MACVTGEIDLATHDGQFHARILGAVSRKESDDKSRRISRKRLEVHLAGQWGRRTSVRVCRGPGHHRARGGRGDPGDIARRNLTGDSLRSVATDLNARGVPTVSGREWRSHVLRKILLFGRRRMGSVRATERSWGRRCARRGMVLGHVGRAPGFGRCRRPRASHQAGAARLPSVLPAPLPCMRPHAGGASF